MKTRIYAFESALFVLVSLLFVSVALAAVPGRPKTQINLNTATAQELTTLPGVGPAAAQNIIAARPFKSVEDLQKVKGISAARYNAMKDMVTVEAAAGAPSAPAPAAKAATGATQPAAKTEPVNINTADARTLETLPGVGPAAARNIIAARPFKSVEDLQKVKGISPAKYNAIKDMVTVSTAAGAQPAAAGMQEPAAGAGGEKMGTMGGEKKGTMATQPSGHEAGKPMLSGPVNINTADLKTLEALPGIGPVKAQAIIEHRPYSTPEDIMKVPGIKQGTFSRIKDQIVVK